MSSCRKAAKAINDSTSYREAYRHAADYLTGKRLKKDDLDYLYDKCKKLIKAVRKGLRFCASSTMLHMYPQFRWDARVVALAINNHLGDGGALDIAFSYLRNNDHDVEKLYAHTSKKRKGLVMLAMCNKEYDIISDLEKCIAEYSGKPAPENFLDDIYDDLKSTRALKFCKYLEPARIVQICNVAHNLETLEICGTPMDDKHFLDIVNRQLISLSVEACDVDINKVRLLVSADSLSTLTCLNLNHNILDDDCVRTLATSNNMPMLSKLDIAGVDMSDDAYNMLAEKIQNVGCFSYRDLPNDPIGEYSSSD